MTEREMTVLPAELTLQLRHLDRRVRGLAALRGIGLVGAVICAGVLGGVLVDWLFDLGVGLRVMLLLGVVAATIAAAVMAIVRPLLRRSSSAELAALVDSSYPDLRERIESAVELADPDLPESQKGSAYMRSQLMKETVRKTEGVDFGRAADTSSTVKWVAVALLTFLLVLAPFGLSRDGYALMLSRFLTPWRNLERATNLFFDVPEGDRVTARGEDVTITAIPKWRLSPGELPDYVWLTWSNANGETDERRMEWSSRVDAYVAVLPHVFSSFGYDISSERARSRQYHIDAVERPDIIQFTLEVIPPAYTGRPVVTLDGAVGTTEVFAQSELTFEVTFNKRVERADFVWIDDLPADVDLYDKGFNDGQANIPGDRQVGRQSSDGKPDDGKPDDGESTDAKEVVLLPLEMNASQTGGRLSLSAERSGAYAIILRDEYELSSIPNVPRELIVTPDAPPQVHWSDLDRSQVVNIPPLEARPDDKVTLPIQAVDDIGVNELALHIEVVQRGRDFGPINAESALLGQPEISHQFDLNLGDFELHEGDLLSVRTKAIDGRPRPAPQTGWSSPRLIRITKDADPAGLQALMQQQQELRDVIEQIRQDVQEDREKVRELERDVATKKKKREPFERQDDVAEVEQNERDVQQRIEQLAAVFEDHPLQQNIAEQARKIANEPIEKARERLQEAESDDANRAFDRLRKVVGELSNADHQLDRLLKRFDELAELERDLQQIQQLADDAEQLAEEVQEFEQDRTELDRLADAKELSGNDQQVQEEQLGERQMDLLDEQQDLVAALDHLIEERPEILEAARQQQRDRLERLAKEAQQLAKHQDRLAAAMRREPEGTTRKQQEADAVKDAEKAADEKAKPSEEPADAGENGEPMPADGQPPEDAPQTDQSQPGDPTGDDPRGDQPKAQQMAEAQEAEAAAAAKAQRDAQKSAIERQQQLAEDAARQAVETARQQGIDSPPAKEARQFAEKAMRAAEEAKRGLLTDAANSAKQAAQSAERTNERLNQAEESPPERMTQQAETLAQQQSEVAERLREESKDETVRQAAESEGQQQLSQQTDRLTQELAETAERLGSEPLHEEQSGERASQANEAAERAQTAQGEAQQQIAEEGLREAAQPARQAAQELFQASKQALQASRQGPRPKDSPVPGEVGEQIADARRQLDEAGEQLQQAGEPQQADAGEMQEGQQPQEGEGEQPGDQPGEQPSEGQPGENGEKQPGEQGEPSAQEGQPGDPSQEGQQPGEDSQPGEGDGQSQPGQNGQPGQQGKPSNQAGSQSMREVADSLRQAAQQMGMQPSQQAKGNSQNNQSGDPQEGADGPHGGDGARGGLSLAELEAELGRISDRNWGQLPDRVESELQQAQRKKPDADYARLIRLYFQEVARQESAVDGLKAATTPEVE